MISVSHPTQESAGRLPRGGRAKARSVLGVLALAASVTAVTAVSAGASSTPKVAPALAPHASAADLAYYKGKTITMYAFTPAATAPDLQARIIAPYIAAYLHASVNVDDVGGGGTIPGQNLAAAQPANGLTIGEVNIVGDIGDFVSNTPGLTFNLRSLPLLTSLPPAETVLVTTPQSGYTSFKQMVGSKTAIPVFAEAASSVTVEEQLLFGAYHIPNKFIYGYTSAAAIVAGFVRGDADVNINAYAVWQSLILGNKAIPVLDSPAAVKGLSGYSILRKVPSLASFAAANPPKTKNERAELQMLVSLLTGVNTAFFAPIGTPTKYQAALNAAIQWAATRGGAKTQMISNGLSAGYVLPAKIKPAINSVLKQQPQLTAWLAATGAP